MIKENLLAIKNNIPSHVTLIAVSKTYPNQSILEAYEAGQRIFGENKVQELVEKYENLPKDIEWQMIGHLQSNKVKFIAPFVKLIHGVDSLKLLQEINKRAEQNHRIIDCLLQVHIAKEETKFGFDEKEILELFQSNEFHALKNIRIIGLMGMATFTDDEQEIRKEFRLLRTLFEKLRISNPQFQIISMGMSSDYKIAIEEGSSMIRVGSSIFGKRNYN